jgi:hypothetical protein
VCQGAVGFWERSGCSRFSGFSRFFGFYRFRVLRFSWFSGSGVLGALDFCERPGSSRFSGFSGVLGFSGLLTRTSKNPEPGEFEEPRTRRTWRTRRTRRTPKNPAAAGTPYVPR